VAEGLAAAEGRWGEAAEARAAVVVADLTPVVVGAAVEAADLTPVVVAEEAVVVAVVATTKDL
jgi:hypothetical protein